LALCARLDLRLHSIGDHTAFLNESIPKQKIPSFGTFVTL